MIRNLPSAHNSVRLETLVALALSKGWPRDEVTEQESLNEGSESTDGPMDLNRGLPEPLQDLSSTDRKAAEVLLRRYEKLSPTDQQRWLDNCLCRVRTATPARDVRLDSSIHPSQIAAALNRESPRMQSLILSLLTPTIAEQTARATGALLKRETSPGTSGVARSKIDEVVRQAFLGQFASRNSLERPTPFDLLSGVELARLIHLLGIRETAIACQNIASVESVTAFLKRFAAEDAHAIVSQLAALQTCVPERIQFAERLAQTAVSEESDVASPMLDRIGLALLAIVLDQRGAPYVQYTMQKLPVAAAQELQELKKETRSFCDYETAQSIAQEAESLANNLHRFAAAQSDERRGKPAI